MRQGHADEARGGRPVGVGEGADPGARKRHRLHADRSERHAKQPRNRRRQRVPGPHRRTARFMKIVRLFRERPLSEYAVTMGRFLGEISFTVPRQIVAAALEIPHVRPVQSAIHEPSFPRRCHPLRLCAPCAGRMHDSVVKHPRGRRQGDLVGRRLLRRNELGEHLGRDDVGRHFGSNSADVYAGRASGGTLRARRDRPWRRPGLDVQLPWEGHAHLQWRFPLRLYAPV